MASTITMRADRVRNLCRQFVEWREDSIARHREEIVQRHMQPRWFGLVRGRTHGEAVKYLQSEGLWSEYGLANFKWGLAADRVQRLLNAAMLADDRDMIAVDVATASDLYVVDMKIIKQGADTCLELKSPMSQLSKFS